MYNAEHKGRIAQPNDGLAVGPDTPRKVRDFIRIPAQITPHIPR